MHIKNSFYDIRVALNKLKKSTLKKIASEIISRGPLVSINSFSDQIYLYILDIIETLIYVPLPNKSKKIAPKHICNVFFDNKAVELIHLPSILNQPDILDLLPEPIQTKENRPVVTYSLHKTIRNKILNYQDTVNSIFIDEEV